MAWALPKLTWEPEPEVRITRAASQEAFPGTPLKGSQKVIAAQAVAHQAVRAIPEVPPRRIPRVVVVQAAAHRKIKAVKATVGTTEMIKVAKETTAEEKVNNDFLQPPFKTHFQCCKSLTLVQLEF